MIHAVISTQAIQGWRARHVRLQRHQMADMSLRTRGFCAGRLAERKNGGQSVADDFQREIPGQADPLSYCNNASLRKATRRLGKLCDSVLEPSGLKATQYSLLTQIHALGHPTMAGLANSLLMDLSAMRHSLGPLIRDGLVRLRVDAKDRRVKRVVLRPPAWRNSSKPCGSGERRKAALKRRSAPRARRSSALS